jgi:hypothetical protein
MREDGSRPWGPFASPSPKFPSACGKQRRRCAGALFQGRSPIYRRRRPPTTRTELIPIASHPALYYPRDLAVIRRTVASDTTDDEFALFIHWARSLRLDPLRRQVHAFVFHKTDPKKRRLSLVELSARLLRHRPRSWRFAIPR